MTPDMAIIILLASGFQVCLDGERIDFLEIKPYAFSDKTIQDAIESLNTEGGYTFIRELTDDTNPIF